MNAQARTHKFSPTNVLDVLSEYRQHITELELKIVEYREAVGLSKDSAALFLARELVGVDEATRRDVIEAASISYADIISVARINTEAARIDDLRSMPYDDYLQTPHWKQLRLKALARAEHRCQVCNRDDVSLHVHHRSYERRGFEDITDLIVLCADCHRTFHESGKIA